MVALPIGIAAGARDASNVGIALVRGFFVLGSAQSGPRMGATRAAQPAKACKLSVAALERFPAQSPALHLCESLSIFP
jgi:hypothetical protein